MRSLYFLLTIFAVSIPIPGFAADARLIDVDKAALIRVDRDPGLILIANPEIADVVVENKRLIFLLGRREGETRLFVLDTRGDEMLNLDIVVTRVGQRRITVQRGTNQATLVCTPRCAPQAMAAGGGSSAAAPAPGGAAAAPALPSLPAE